MITDVVFVNVIGNKSFLAKQKVIEVKAIFDR